MRFLRFLGHAFVLTHRADRRATLLLIVLFTAQAGVVAATGLSLRWLLDAVAARDFAGFALAVVVGAAAFGIGAVSIRVSFTLRVYLMERVDVALTKEILSASTAVPTVEHLEHPEYLDRLELLRKGTWALSTSVWSFAGGLSAALSLAASVVLLALVHPVVAILAVLAVPPLLASRRAATIAREVEDASSEINRREQALHKLTISADSSKELRISGSGATLNIRAESLWNQATTMEAMGRLRGAAWQIGGWVCYAAGFFIALWIVAGLIAEGRATVGDAVLVVSLSTQLLGQIRLVVWNVGRVAEAGRVVGHYQWLLEYAASQPAGTHAPPVRLDDGIVLQGVRFRYPGAEAEAIRGVDLRLGAGQIVALVGVNGAGKTTLVKLLTGMYRPSAGAILVDGRPLGEIEPDLWRGHLSAVFQDFARFQFRAWETIGVGDVGRLHDRGAVGRAVARAEAHDVVGRLPDGLETQLGPIFNGPDLSVGQWQTLAVARSLMRTSPALVVLDEPTAALDAQAEHDLFTYFTRQAKVNAATHGTTTLLVSHRFSTVRMADLIVVINDGQIVEQGNHDELMSADGAYAELYRLQASAYTGGERVS